MSSGVFNSVHQQSIERVNGRLDQLLSQLDTPSTLREAMHYSVMNGGKRLRPTLVYAASTAVRPQQLSDDSETLLRADAAAIAVELMHSYSLVHDDLPAMDDDDLRRGKPSCHIAYGEACAILVGDALQTLAFEHLANCQAMDDSCSRALSRCLSKAAGASGMVSGQLQDMQAVADRNIGLAELETLHRAKTGALICAALEMGAICAGGDQPAIAALASYGEQLGLAFQVIDDVLDVTGSTEELGKQQGSDQLLGKATYPGLMGLAEAEAYGKQLCEQAKQELLESGLDQQVLIGLADFVAHRRH